MKKILITGGAGFIGSCLAEDLLEKGYDVFVLDDLSTGSLENILHLRSQPRFHFRLGTIMDRPVVENMVKECDEVYHLAAVVGVKLVFEKPIHTITVNVRGTENVLSVSLQFARKVLIASTSEVYGKDVNPRSKKFKEDDDLSLGTSLRWSYACSKALDEYLALAFHRERGLPLVIARIFNTVGPRQSKEYGMVIPRLTSQAIGGLPMTVYGDGSQVRSFIWGKDTVRALIGLMEEPRAAGQIFNVGHEQEITINALASKIKAKTKSSSPIVHIPYDQAYGKDFEDIRYRIPDISKIREMTGFEPSLSIDEILDRIIAHHQSLRKE